jgi:hypothetical protein
VKRLPDLTHVLDDSAPHTIPATGMNPVATSGTAPTTGIDKRLSSRFDKAFLVVIGSELYGDSFAVARNLSAGGILVEMCYAPPLGSVVTVHFQYVRDPEQTDEIVARAEVKHHHYLNFTGGGEAARSRAIGLRFVEFVDLGDAVPQDRLH